MDCSLRPESSHLSVGQALSVPLARSAASLMGAAVGDGGL
jgi:hypothetical protein